MFNRVKGMLVVTTVLMLTACGNSDEAPTFSIADQAEGIQQDESIEPTLKPQPAPQSTLLCEDPAPIELSLGETIDASIEDPEWTRCYWVDVPEGLTSVTFELGGLSSDLNLAVGYGFLVTLQYSMGEFWQEAQSGTTDEMLVIENPTPGPYFVKVGIAGPKDPSQFKLSIRTEPETSAPASGVALPEPGKCASPATEVAIKSEVDSEVVARAQDPLPRRYFCVQVPEGLSNLTIKLTGLEGDLEIFVRRTRPAEWIDRSRGGSERTVVIENPESGAYFIDVVGAYTGAESPFTLSVSSP